ncbi:MAG TPA: retroviral-like aspartic protease family protein [Sphingobium sp.]|nr:retroviral-like aspartic protease family protein [Sphingobium sp.]
MLVRRRFAIVFPALLAVVLLPAGRAIAQADTARTMPSPPADPGDFIITPSNSATTLAPDHFAVTEQPIRIGRDDGERMTMPVEIIGGGTYDFVIDTGSQRTIIATELAAKLAMLQLPPVEIVSMAGRVTVAAVILNGLKYGDHVVERMTALSIAQRDLGSAGIIGLDGLRDKRLTLDFRTRRMEVGTSRRAPRKQESDPDTIIVEARSRLGQLILVDSRIDGKRVNVILDTGAELSVGNMALFNRLKLKRLVIPPTPTTLTSVTGAQVPALFTVVRNISIGTVRLGNVPMVFLDAAPFAELDLADTPAMLLGMRMLRMFDQVAIDFGSRHVDFHLKSGAADGSSRLADAASRSYP